MPVAAAFLPLPTPAASGSAPSAPFLLLATLSGLALLALVYRILENRRKKVIRRKFRRFSEARPVRTTEMRSGERLAVPEALQAEITLTDGEWFGLKGWIVDVSPGGFGVKPDFPLKKIPLETTLGNVLVNGPGTSFVVRRARTVRIEHREQRRLLGLQILAIDDGQNRELLAFIGHLQEFLHHDRSRNTG